jgi:hypothetical protein
MLGTVKSGMMTKPAQAHKKMATIKNIVLKMPLTFWIRFNRAFVFGVISFAFMA